MFAFLSEFFKALQFNTLVAFLYMGRIKNGTKNSSYKSRLFAQFKKCRRRDTSGQHNGDIATTRLQKTFFSLALFMPGIKDVDSGLRSSLFTFLLPRNSTFLCLAFNEHINFY